MDNNVFYFPWVRKGLGTYIDEKDSLGQDGIAMGRPGLTIKSNYTARHNQPADADADQTVRLGVRHDLVGAVHHELLRQRVPQHRGGVVESGVDKHINLDPDGYITVLGEDDCYGLFDICTDEDDFATNINSKYHNTGVMPAIFRVRRRFRPSFRIFARVMSVRWTRRPTMIIWRL